MDSFVDRLGADSTARLTFIGCDGIVWGDTERDGQHLRDMDNHRNRPEIQEALAGGIGTIDRYSHTVMTTLRYLALPLQRRFSATEQIVQLSHIDEEQTLESFDNL